MHFSGRRGQGGKGGAAMPKIIDEAREKILSAAKHTLLGQGYSALSLRGVARQCGIAVGTIYNYFESKDMLIACIMVEDWEKALAQMDAACAAARTAGEGLAAMHGAIRQFASIYEGVWSQFFSAGGSPGVVAGRHGMLRGQLAARIQALAARLGCGAQSLQLAPLAAEAVLAAAMQADIPAAHIILLADRLFPAGKGEEIQQK